MNRNVLFPAPVRRRFRGVFAFVATELRVQLHEWIVIATSVTVQVILLLFVWVLARDSAPPLFPYAVVGAVVFSVFQLGQRVQNEAAYVRIDHRLNELYHASPLTPESYFLGMAGGILLAYLPPIAALVGFAEWVHPMTWMAAAVLFLALAGLFVFAASVGYTVSTLFKDMRTIWPYASLFYNLFGVLPPVFYPIWLFPVALRPIALLIPPSAAAALIGSAWGIPVGLSGSEITLAGVSLAIEAVAFALLATLWARRAARER
jgi:ABC-2 type transport system permease protein